MSSSPPPARSDLRPVRWGLGDAWLGLLLGNAAALVVGVLILSATGYTETESDELPLTIIALLQVPLWLGYLTMPVLAARRKGNGLVEDFGLRLRPLDVPVGLVIGVLTQLVVVPLVYVPIFWVIGDRDVSADARALTDRADSPVGVVLLVLIVVIGAPIVEELFFRGLLLRSLEHRWGSAWGLLVSSLIFGAVHLQPLQFPALVVVGLVLGVLAQRTGRLGPSIFAHIAFNAVAVGTLLAAR
jgi:membrane protease YdiL (CAAX protease family)